jgi:YbbR domain-containing protein
LSRISVAHVTVIRENISSTIIDDYPFTLLDEYGEELDEELLEQLTFSDETVRVTVPIRMIREVPLRVDFFHGAGTSDENINYMIEPMSIVLTGDPVAFQDLSAITLGTIDTTRFGLTTVTPEIFNIIVPSNLDNVSGITQANVSLEVIGLEWDSYTVANINAVNVPIGYEAIILNEIMVVRVRGTRPDLNYLAEFMNAGGLNIRIEVDLDGLEQGTHRLQPPNVRIFIDGIDRDIGAVGVPAEYLITVRIAPIPDELE